MSTTSRFTTQSALNLGLATFLAALPQIVAGPSSLQLPEGAAATGQKSTTHSTLMAPYDPPVDASGDPVTDATAPVYNYWCNFLFGLPNNVITTSTGEPVTLGQWSSATGEATAKCTGEGTRISVHMKDLVPKGVYTFWLVVFEAPGFDFEYTHAIAMGALGLSEGSQNTVRVSASGEAQFTVVQKAGSLSMAGEVTNCLLDEFEFQLVLALHLDGETNGPVPGDDCFIAEHLALDFKPSPND